MNEQNSGQMAYDIYATILSLRQKFGPQPKNRPVSAGEIQRFLVGGATKADILAWALHGEARGAMRGILGIK